MRPKQILVWLLIVTLAILAPLQLNAEQRDKRQLQNDRQSTAGIASARPLLESQARQVREDNGQAVVLHHDRRLLLLILLAAERHRHH